ncbi:hypothetical protein PINS_up023161 [Pythium insidiosum]|nr:hypothetical protein PINS_up011289 [Pythium insidiosum]GLE10889.1 hypothetical protein PINS_up023161 [Pythium insidiosum]
MWVAISLAGASDGHRRAAPSFPFASLIYFAICLLVFAAFVYTGHRMASTQRCIVTATALQYSATRWMSVCKSVPLDAIEQVNVRTNCIDRCYGIVNVLVETAASLQTDSEGDKKASAAYLLAVVDAEGVQRAILDRRDALRRQRPAAVAGAAHHVVVDMKASVGQLGVVRRPYD